MREEIIGDCRLILADCMDVLPTLGKVDAVVTDPPFEKEAHTLQRRINRGKTRGGSSDLVTAEPLPFAEIGKREGYAKEIARVSNGWALAFCQAEAVQAWRKAFEDGGASYRRAMVWIKPDGMPQYSGDRPGMGYESIVAVWCGEGKSHWNGGGKHGVYTFNKNDFPSGAPHPTTKPVALMAALLRDFTGAAQTILDPFMGSGTTGVACVKMGRSFIGIEREEEYFNIAVKRIREAYAQPDMFVEATKPMVQDKLI